MEEQLRRRDELEAEGWPSLDRAADTFAELLRAAAPSSGEESRDRAMEQLLYHLGRWIYLLDAQDDSTDAEGWTAQLPSLFREVLGVVPRSSVRRLSYQV